MCIRQIILALVEYLNPTIPYEKYQKYEIQQSSLIYGIYSPSLV